MILAYWSASHASAQTFVERIEIRGAERTRERTIVALLPRNPPGFYSAPEVAELARRISNLEIFDQANVECDGNVLRIRVREKWTLVPDFDLAGGESLKDLYLFLGATEYNLFGTGNVLELSVYRERRGFGFHTSFKEHVYRRDRWSLGVEASYETYQLRFAGNESWYNASALVYLWTTSTPILSDYLRYEVGAFYKHETIEDATGQINTPNGHIGGSSMMFTWDTYEWNDLTPSGVSANLTLTPGFFFDSKLPRARHRLDFKLVAALPLASMTALMARIEAGGTTLGNANHSLLIGSIRGVRGLDDSYYFNWLQGYMNIELRQALRLATRWAVQGVAFVDGGAFERITAQGKRGGGQLAFSVGIGMRIIPTWLSGLVFRFDVARLMTPDQTFFYQYGLSQYF